MPSSRVDFAGFRSFRVRNEAVGSLKRRRTTLRENGSTELISHRESRRQVSNPPGEFRLHRLSRSRLTMSADLGCHASLATLHICSQPQSRQALGIAVDSICGTPVRAMTECNTDGLFFVVACSRKHERVLKCRRFVQPR